MENCVDHGPLKVMMGHVASLSDDDWKYNTFEEKLHELRSKNKTGQ